jgi:hypothetical protein
MGITSKKLQDSAACKGKTLEALPFSQGSFVMPGDAVDAKKMRRKFSNGYSSILFFLI